MGAGPGGLSGCGEACKERCRVRKATEWDLVGGSVGSHGMAESRGGAGSALGV